MKKNAIVINGIPKKIKDSIPFLSFPKVIPIWIKFKFNNLPESREYNIDIRENIDCALKTSVNFVIFEKIIVSIM